ncbi:alpha/beta hydrolase [Sutcliffiella deserti]|uniref:poly(ethylene terephthalate) hydrolase family protein n=1 Tax=Sutcliffiella deserti TaxID=2875501 RepID=UPI001CBA9E0B|nr:hypothetical protein [Sutcliffiella deserti]
MKWIKRVYQRVLESCHRFIDNNWRSIITGLLTYFLLFVIFIGFFFLTGVGKWFDVTFTIGTAILSMALGFIISVIIIKLLKQIPVIMIASVIGVIVAINSVGLYLGPFFRMMSYSILILGALAGLTFHLYRSLSRRKLWIAGLLSLITLFSHGLFIYLVTSEGQDGAWSLEVDKDNPSHGLANPATPGPLSINHFTYGSGDDQRREEYRKVEYTTRSVNLSPFIIKPKGFNKWYREWFWGFNIHHAPLNGRVWMPEDTEGGPYPLVLMVHGNHNMADFSDGGYGYIGELLASKGYIAVSIDENFLNSGKSGHIGWDNSGRAWMFLKHLEQWDKWNKDLNHPLHNTIDMENIALIGHSRGGEAVSIAALMNKLDRFPNNAKTRLDFDFSIKSLIGLSPGDGRFKLGDQPIELKNINYLTLQGANDTDHTNYLGMRQFERVSFSDDFDGFKSSVYLYGANHGQFNTDWEVDQPAPYWWFMNRKELLEPELQRKMTKTYISAFLDATLKGKREYREVFSQKETVAAWIPTDPIRLRYEDNTFTPLATFEEDVDVTTITAENGVSTGHNLQVWKEVSLTLRNKEPQDNQAVMLGWRNTNARYSLDVPENISATLNKSSVLTFDAIQLHSSRYQFYGIQMPKEYINKAIPISVIVKTKGKMTFDSRNRTTVMIEPTYSSKLYRFEWWNERFGNNYEHMLQTYEVPLEFLEEELSSIVYEDVEEIIFEFNQVERGLLFLDNIGFKE